MKVSYLSFIFFLGVIKHGCTTSSGQELQTEDKTTTSPLTAPEITTNNDDVISTTIALITGFENQNSSVESYPASLMQETSQSSPNKLELTTTDKNIAEIIEKMQRSPSLNSGIEAVLVLVVIQTMLGLGCTMDLQIIKEHLMQPTGIIIAAVCQFGIMPFVSFLMAKIFGLDKVAAIAILVTGSCPGGNLSNLLTYFLYGDTNLSILMSTISTMLALIMMPLCIFIYGSSWIDVSMIGQLVPFGGVILTLILTLLPVGVGIGIRMKSEKVANTILKISLISVCVSFIALMLLSIILFQSSIFSAISGSSYVIAFITPLIGYGSGYLLATGFRLPDASRRTVAIETGCQNSQLSSTILKMAFAQQTMGAYFLFPLYYALFQGLEGLGMILAFRVYRRYHADEVLAAHSRITYEKFDTDWSAELGGEDPKPIGGTLYQRSPSSSGGSYNSDLATTSGRNVPHDLPLKHKFSPEEGFNNANDSSQLVSGRQNSTGGILNYGGTQ